MALQAIFQPAEKTRVFLQYDPARGYDLAEVGRQVKLYEIGDQLSALKPEDEQKRRVIEQQLVQMFKNYSPDPLLPGIHDVGRDSPTKAYLPARGGRPPEEVPARIFERARRRHDTGACY